VSVKLHKCGATKQAAEEDLKGQQLKKTNTKDTDAATQPIIRQVRSTLGERTSCSGYLNRKEIDRTER